MTDIHNYQPRPDLLQGRVILVTGATRGIGRVAALTFAAYGATVVLHGRDVSALEKVYDEIKEKGHAEPAAIPLDLERAGTRDFDGLAYAIESRLGRLDGLLHNAAHFERLSALELQTAEEWNRTPIPRLYLAGDYTASDHPATLESAVRSGVACAKLVLEDS